MAMLAHSIGPSERRAIRCVNPATGEPIGEVPVASAEEVRAAVARARAAQPAWHALGVEERARRIRAFCDKVIQDHVRVVQTEQKENGKIAVEILGELTVLFYSTKHFVRVAKRLEKGKRVGRGLLPTKRDRIEYPPLGVAAVISPWNYPIMLAYWQILPALLVGNAVVHKPSEHTPMVHMLLAEMMREVGAPYELVTGDGATGAVLTECDVDIVSFTGSLATGRKVMAACAKRPIPCVLELGSKDPLVVLEDANLDRAVEAALFGAYLNAGQQCVSIERAYVDRRLYDAFVQKAAARTRELRLGLDGDVGPMTTAAQVDIVERHVKDALSRGAKALAGGKRPDRPGFWFEPTVLVDVNHSMQIMREETFGPVLPIVPFDTDDEAVRLANDSEYGLGAAVFGKRPHARAVAARLEVGMVAVNDYFTYAFNPKLPWGGAKHSGVGRALAEEGVTKFCRVTAVSEDTGILGKELYWYPYRDRHMKMFKALLALQSPGLGAKIKRLWGGW